MDVGSEEPYGHGETIQPVDPPALRAGARGRGYKKERCRLG